MSVSFWYCQVSFSSTSNRNRAWSEINVSISTWQLICFTRNNTYLSNCQVNWITLNNLQSVCLFNNTDSSMSVNASCDWQTNSRTIDYWIYNWNGSLCGSSSCPDCPVCSENICNLYVSQDWINSHFQYSWNIDRFTLNLDENITWFNSVNWNSSNFNFHSSCLTWNECTWSIESWNWSALFINDIQHVSAPLINITIPEEFDRNYTWNDEEFDLSISWYNVDTEYIDWLIRTQTTLPNSTDFNNTVSWLIPLFVPWLVIILLIYFIFRFIKKIF